MLGFQLTLLSLAGVISILFGLRYFVTKQFMPYHAVVAGRSWAELEGGVQVIIVGMLRIIAGGLTTYGLALLWLLVPLSGRQLWAAWAALTLTAATVLPTLYVTIALRRAAPKARTPVVPAAIVLVMAIVGAAISFAL